MASSDQEIVSDLLPLLRVYKNGHVERLIGSEIVPPSPHDSQTGVSSKDIKISDSISARLYLPKPTTDSSPHHQQKLPLLLYIHGGGFCIESAFSHFHQRYLNILASQANVIAVSVEYRLAPGHPLPTAYEDCWAALQWVLSHSKTDKAPTFSDGSSEPWLIDYVDFSTVFLGGDSAGANIVHNIAMRAGRGGIKHRGAFLAHPYFWGSDPIGSETGMDPDVKSLMERIWLFVNPSASSTGGIDDPMINPFAPGAPSLSSLGCERVLVCVAGKDILKERGRLYCEELEKSGWEGEVELFEVEEEGHAFHVFNRLMINGVTVFPKWSHKCKNCWSTQFHD